MEGNHGNSRPAENDLMDVNKKIEPHEAGGENQREVTLCENAQQKLYFLKG